jgi:hypothetical protein
LKSGKARPAPLSSNCGNATPEFTRRSALDPFAIRPQPFLDGIDKQPVGAASAWLELDSYAQPV